MSNYSHGELAITAKGKRWVLSKLDKDDPLRQKLIDDLNASGEPLHVPGEMGCTERGHDIRKCNTPRCRARHKAILLGIARRYETVGNKEKASEYRERWRRR